MACRSTIGTSPAPRAPTLARSSPVPPPKPTGGGTSALRAANSSAYRPNLSPVRLGARKLTHPCFASEHARSQSGHRQIGVELLPVRAASAGQDLDRGDLLRGGAAQ